MTFFNLLLALMLAALAAVGAMTSSGGTQSGDGTVISDPNTGGTDSGTVDRGDTGTTTPGTGTTTTTRTARLSWNAPLAREDGEPLRVGEITGYRVRVERQGSTTIQLRSVSASSTSTSFSLTSAGTYHFSIAAVDASGVYSDYSARVTATFN